MHERKERTDVIAGWLYWFYFSRKLRRNHSHARIKEYPPAATPTKIGMNMSSFPVFGVCEETADDACGFGTLAVCGCS
eukprot:1823813-Rhodomonas_salina.2